MHLKLVSSSLLEQMALEQRLKHLGVRVDGFGAVDGSRAQAVAPDATRGGAALERVAQPNGDLGLSDASRLVKREWLGLGVTDQITDAESTRTLESLTSSVRSFVKALGDAKTELAGGLSDAMLGRLRVLAKCMNAGLGLISTGRIDLGRCEPATVRKAAEGLEELAQATSSFGVALSEARVRCLSSSATDPKQRRHLVESSLVAASVIDTIHAGARLLSTSDASEERRAREEAERLLTGASAQQTPSPVEVAPRPTLAQLTAAASAAREAEAADLAARRSALTHSLPSLHRAGIIAELAEYVRVAVKVPPSERPAPNRGPALEIGPLDPLREVAPHHPRLFVTAHGLRVFTESQRFLDLKDAREPTPHELASCGWSVAKLEAAVRGVVKHIEAGGAPPARLIQLSLEDSRR